MTDVESVVLDQINSKNITCENDGCMINSINSDIFILNNSKFDDFISMKNAGILSIKDPKDITIHNCIFQNSKSQISGGAIYIENTIRDYVNFNINFCIFNNIKSGSGGILSLINVRNQINFDYQNKIQNSFLTNGSALQRGGAIYSINSNFTFVNCTFANNYALIGGLLFYSDMIPQII